MSVERNDPLEEQPMADASLAEEAGQMEPVAVGPGDPDPTHPGNGAAGPDLPDDRGPDLPDDGARTAPDDGARAARAGDDAALLSLVDRFAAVLERSDLGELEVTAGGTTIILRAPSAIERALASTGPSSSGEGLPALVGGASAQGGGAHAQAATQAAPAARPSVKAPLTGIFYGAPSPGATAYVAVGDHVSVGQIIGLIEAMKLFNEIKSDLAGRVARICADNGALVKAKQALIEVEPA